MDNITMPFWCYLLLVFFASAGLSNWVILIVEILTGKRKFRKP